MMLNSSSSASKFHGLKKMKMERAMQSRRGGQKGGSLSPNKQNLDMNSGFSNFFLQLNLFAAKNNQTKENNSERSSEKSKDNEDDKALMQTRELISRPLTYRLGTAQPKNEEELLLSNEPTSREAPLFISPQTAYRKYQQQIMKSRREHSGLVLNNSKLSHDYANASRSPNTLTVRQKSSIHH